MKLLTLANLCGNRGLFLQIGKLASTPAVRQIITDIGRQIDSGEVRNVGLLLKTWWAVESPSWKEHWVCDLLENRRLRGCCAVTGHHRRPDKDLNNYTVFLGKVA